MLIRFVLVFITFAFSEAKLPNFIERCHLSDPQLEKCFLENGKKAVSHIILGVEELEIPPLAKIKMPTVNCIVNESFVLTFNGNMEGLDKIEFENSTFQKEQSKGSAAVFIPSLKLVGKCMIDSTLGDTVVKSAGHCILKFDLAFIYGYVLTMFDADALNYMKLVRPLLIWHGIDNASYRFNKLLTHDTLKKKKLNKLLDQEQDALSNVLGPIVANHVIDIMFDISNKIYGSAPSNEVFLP